MSYLKRRRNPLGRQRWAELVRLRLEGMGTSEIARTMRLSPGTVSEALRIPAIAAELKTAREAALGEVLDQLGSAASDAVATLVELANDRKQPGRVRLGAATEILDRVGATASRTVQVHHAGQVEHVAKPLVTRDEWAALDPEAREGLRLELLARLEDPEEGRKAHIIDGEDTP